MTHACSLHTLIHPPPHAVPDTLTPCQPPASTPSCHLRPDTQVMMHCPRWWDNSSSLPTSQIQASLEKSLLRTCPERKHRPPFPQARSRLIAPQRDRLCAPCSPPAQPRPQFPPTFPLVSPRPRTPPFLVSCVRSYGWGLRGRQVRPEAPFSLLPLRPGRRGRGPRLGGPSRGQTHAGQRSGSPRRSPGT